MVSSHRSRFSSDTRPCQVQTLFHPFHPTFKIIFSFNQMFHKLFFQNFSCFFPKFLCCFIVLFPIILFANSSIYNFFLSISFHLFFNQWFLLENIYFKYSFFDDFFHELLLSFMISFILQFFLLSFISLFH